MKGKSLILLIGAVLFYIGCSTSMIGKKAPYRSVHPLFAGENTYYLNSGDVIECYYDRNTLTGKLIFAEQSGASGHEITNLTLVAWFADSRRIFRTKGSYSWEHSDQKSMDEGLDFTIEIPDGFNDIVFIGFSYHGTYIH